MTITSSQQCLSFYVTGAVLSQWPTRSTQDQFIDETLMNPPSARHWHLRLCLWLSSFWKQSVMSIVCLLATLSTQTEQCHIRHTSIFCCKICWGTKFEALSKIVTIVWGNYLGKYCHNSCSMCLVTIILKGCITLYHSQLRCTQSFISFLVFRTSVFWHMTQH